MSVYFVKGKGYRYDFTLKGRRYTEVWFKTKREAQAAEVKRREEVKNPKLEMAEKPTDITFLELVNLRLDFVNAYKTKSYYDDNRYVFKKLIQKWEELVAKEISHEMVQRHILDRSRESNYAANYDLRLLRALFNHGVRLKVIESNPTDGVPFLPVEKKIKFIPKVDDVEKVLAAADPDTRDYLIAIQETMARVSEINRLTWEDVDLESRLVTLYTRKKKGGHLTPRRVPMTERLFDVLSRRYQSRETGKPWVFWHTYWSSKTGEKKDGPFQDRKLIMRNLCRRARVPYFRFHALRHLGASIMDANNVPIGSVQKILGHENRATTEIYLHGIGECEKLAIATYELARKKFSHEVSHNAKGVTVH